MTGGQPPRPPREFRQCVIQFIYDSVRTRARENHFELIDGTPTSGALVCFSWSADTQTAPF